MPPPALTGRATRVAPRRVRQSFASRLLIKVRRATPTRPRTHTLDIRRQPRAPPLQKTVPARVAVVARHSDRLRRAAGFVVRSVEIPQRAVELRRTFCARLTRLPPLVTLALIRAAKVRPPPFGRRGQTAPADVALIARISRLTRAASRLFLPALVHSLKHIVVPTPRVRPQFAKVRRLIPTPAPRVSEIKFVVPTDVARVV